jgi:hypothetical protein
VLYDDGEDCGIWGLHNGARKSEGCSRGAGGEKGARSGRGGETDLGEAWVVSLGMRFVLSHLKFVVLAVPILEIRSDRSGIPL